MAINYKLIRKNLHWNPKTRTYILEHGPLENAPTLEFHTSYSKRKVLDLIRYFILWSKTNYPNESNYKPYLK